MVRTVHFCNWFQDQYTETWKKIRFQVTTAIISYCSPPEKPKQAWGEEPRRAAEKKKDEEEEKKWRQMRRRGGEEEGEESDHSGDSGIDRSDDFCQEPLASTH